MHPPMGSTSTGCWGENVPSPGKNICFQGPGILVFPRFTSPRHSHTPLAVVLGQGMGRRCMLIWLA